MCNPPCNHPPSWRLVGSASPSLPVSHIHSGQTHVWYGVLTPYWPWLLLNKQTNKCKKSLGGFRFYVPSFAAYLIVSSHPMKWFFARWRIFWCPSLHHHQARSLFSFIDVFVYSTKVVRTVNVGKTNKMDENKNLAATNCQAVEDNRREGSLTVIDFQLINARAGKKQSQIIAFRCFFIFSLFVITFSLSFPSHS